MQHSESEKMNYSIYGARIIGYHIEKLNSKQIIKNSKQNKQN